MLLLVLLGLAAFSIVAFGVLRTVKSEKSKNQAVFTSGQPLTIPAAGLYRGSVTGYTGSWQGKFFGEEGQGSNLFQENGREVRKYPFAFYQSQGLRDKNLEVIRLDYNQPGNPWWLRFIVDEIVADGPNTYLGKVHVRLMPSLVFTMGYFTLEKP